MSEKDEQDGPAESLRRALLSWLDGGDSRPGQLARWLQGYDLPALGGGDEPYVSLLYALPVGGDRHPYETRLAERAARLVNEKPDVHRPGDMPERLIYNLLYLCSGLNAPDQLADPLCAMYERRSLEGHWMGVLLYDALLSALVPNQADNYFSKVWRQMLAGEETWPLRGNRYDGFEGILWMPGSENTGGEPDLKSLGEALGAMAYHLDKHPRRRLEFSSLIGKVQSVFFDDQKLATDLLILSHEFEWPEWAVECLPTLSIVVGAVAPALCHAGREWEHDCQRVIVWWPYAKLLEAGAHIADFWYKPEKSFCREQLFQMIVPRKEISFIARLAPYLESNRVHNPFHSYYSVVGNIADAMSNCESEPGVEGQWLEILERAHKEILSGEMRGARSFSVDVEVADRPYESAVAGLLDQVHDVHWQPLQPLDVGPDVDGL